MPGPGQIVGLRVERAKDRVLGHAGVEAVDEGLEEGHPAGSLVQADGLTLHVPRIRSARTAGGHGPSPGRSAATRCQDLPSVWTDGA